MGAPKNRKWEIGEKHHFVGTFVGVETGGGGGGCWCHSQVKTANGCNSVGGGCHGPADVSCQALKINLISRTIDVIYDFCR